MTEGNSTARTARPRRIPLPMSSGVSILPGTTARIRARPQVDAFWFRRLLIRHAEHWVVEGLWRNERALYQGRIRGQAFIASATHAPLQVSDPWDAGDAIDLQVTYVGPCVSGEPLVCCALGAEGRQGEARGEARDPDQTKTLEIVSVRPSSGPYILPCTSVTLTIDVPRATGAFWPETIAIRDAVDWIVHDVQVKGESLLLVSGDLPGVLFSGSPGGPLLRMGLLAPGDEVLIVASYIGANARGAVLECELSGPRHARDQSGDALDALLPMSSGVNLPPDACATMTTGIPQDLRRPAQARRRIPAGHGFRPRRIVLANADDWAFGDFKIGTASQFACTGDVPGAVFSPEAPGGLISLDPARPGIDIVATVAYLGESASGTAFYCGIAGDIVPLSREPQGLASNPSE